MLPDYQIFCVDLSEGSIKIHIRMVDHITRQLDVTVLILRILAELDGTNKLNFYFIDLIDAVIRSIQDPTLADKLYHKFEFMTDEDGQRFGVFDKANSGLVFESFQLLDPESAPVLVIVAIDASHHGNNTILQTY